MVPLSLVPSVRRPLRVYSPITSSVSHLCHTKSVLSGTLIYRVFKINNTWLGFHKDIVNLVFILRKNLFPVHLIDKCVYRYLNTAIERNGSIQNTTSQGKQYFYKLPYLGRFSTIVQSKIRRLVNRYCHDLDIKLVFTTFKL